jgi:hypothetical protein
VETVHREVEFTQPRRSLTIWWAQVASSVADASACDPGRPGWHVGAGVADTQTTRALEWTERIVAPVVVGRGVTSSETERSALDATLSGSGVWAGRPS